MKASHMPLQTVGEIPTRVWITETVARVMLLRRVLNLAGQALDLAVEPLRLIEATSEAIVEEGSSKSKEDFKECRDNL